MPNHTWNRLVIEEGSNLVEVITPFLNDKGELDFMKVKPMPEELLHVTSPTRVLESVEELDKLSELEKKSNQYITKDREKELIEKYKAVNWYDWAIRNWGTKWNAYDFAGLDEDYCEFYTAWTPPTELIRTLSEITGKKFTLYYYGEGYEFVGYTKFHPTEDIEYEDFNSPSEAPEWLLNEIGYEEDEDNNE